MLVKVEGKETQTAVRTLIKRVRQLPAELRKSLTWDRGMEMARYKEFSVAADDSGLPLLSPYDPAEVCENHHLIPSIPALRTVHPRITLFNVHGLPTEQPR